MRKTAFNLSIVFCIYACSCFFWAWLTKDKLAENLTLYANPILGMLLIMPALMSSQFEYELKHKKHVKPGLWYLYKILCDFGWWYHGNRSGSIYYKYLNKMCDLGYNYYGQRYPFKK